MGKLSNFFNRNSQKTSIVEDTPSPIPLHTLNALPPPSTEEEPLLIQTIPTTDAPILFHPKLSSLANSLMSIPLTKDSGNRMAKLAYDSQLTRSKLAPIALELENYIASYQMALSQLKDSQVLLTEHIANCSQLLESNLQDETPTHETFNQCACLEIIKKQLLFLSNCQKLLPQLFLDDSPIKLNDLFKQYATCISKSNTILATLEQFTPIANTLRTDILTFTEAVNKMQSNTGLSVDWNGQKASFIKARDDLESRRNAYLQDEEVLNTTINQMYQDCLTLHEQFQTTAPHILPLLTTLRENTPSDNNLTLQRSQINQIIMKLLSVQTELSGFINDL